MAVQVDEPKKPAATTQRRPWRRRLRLVLWGAMLLLLLGLGLSLWTLTHLDAPWLRERVRAECARRLGIELDYGPARLGWSGLVLEHLIIASPPADRDLAPELLHIDRIAVTWQAGDLVRRHWRLTGVDVTGVALSVVVDRANVTSLQRFLAALPPSPETPPTPLSTLLRALREGPPLSVERLAVRGVHMRIGRRLANDVQWWRLGDLQLDGRMHTGTAKPVLAMQWTGAPGLRLQVTGPHGELPLLAPLRAAVPVLAPVLAGEGELPLRWVGSIELTGQDGVLAKMDLQHARSLEALFTLDVSAQMLPEQQAMRVVLRQLAVLGVAQAQAMMTVADVDTGTVLADVGHLVFDVHVPQLHVPPGLLAADVGQLDLAESRLRLTVADLRIGRDPATSTIATLDLRTSCKTAALLDPAVTAKADGLSLGIHVAAPAPGKFKATGRLLLANAHAVSPAGTVTAVDAGLDLEGEWTPDGMALRATMPVATLRARTGDGRQVLDVAGLEGRLDLRTASLSDVMSSGIKALRGLTGAIDAERVQAANDGQTFTVGQLHAGLTLADLLPLPGNVLTAEGDVKLDARFATLTAPGGVALREGSVTATLGELRADLSQPPASTGHLTADLHLGPLTGHADVDRQGTQAVWHAVWAVPSFGALAAMLPIGEDLRRSLAWSKLAMTGRSDGTVRDLLGAMPHVEQRTTMEMNDFAWHHAGLAVDLPRLQVNLSSQGRGQRQQAAFEVTATSPHVDGFRGHGDHVLSGRIGYEPAGPRLSATIRGAGPQGFETTLDLDAKAAGRDVAYDLKGHVGGLAAMLRSLPASQRQALCLADPGLTGDLQARGVLEGGAALLRPGSGAVPSGDGRHHVEADLGRLSCHTPGTDVSVRRVEFAADVVANGRVLRAEGQMSATKLDVSTGGRNAQIGRWQQRFTANLGAHDMIRFTSSGRIDRLDQDVLPTWPARDLSFSMSGWSGPEGARLETFEFDDPASGTHLKLAGGLDRAALSPPRVTDADVAGVDAHAVQAEGTTDAGAGFGDPTEPVPGRKGLSITGELRQDVAKLAAATKLVQGKGTITVPFRVESGDLTLYRAEAQLRFANVDVALPDMGVELQDINGVVPAAEAFVLAPGFKLLGGGEDNAYARWRFAEHQPFLRRDDFLSVGRVRYRNVEFGPLAGNTNLDRNVFRLDQLEVAVLQGKLTGQCIVLVDGTDTRVLLRGNATGLKVLGSDERLDMNAALTFLPGRMDLEGRAEILHIGRKHLEAMLDLWDPYHEDEQANKTRMFLKVGHPQQVRLTFQQGFADVAISLGGLADVVRIDEMRGIALGPVFQRYLEPLLAPLQRARAAEVHP